MSTSLENFYKNTLFKTKKHVLAVAFWMIESHTKISKDAVARMLEEAVKSSCRKAEQNEFKYTWLKPQRGDKMAGLRIYWMYCGNMLALVRCRNGRAQ